MPQVTSAGATQFARYAFPPNDLGYCGPDGATDLLEHTTAGGGELEVARRAPLFDGAWAYLQVLGSAAGLDPLDPRVVDAYWVGNDLLAAVDPDDLLAALQDRFQDQAGGLLPRVAASRDVVAHHGFHVFAVYPWVGLLSRGGDVPRSVLDSCRIRWGTVVSVVGERVEVDSRPLTWDGIRLGLGPSRVESVRWSTQGRSLDVAPGAGDVVSMHWDWICERLTATQAEALEQATGQVLSMANALL